MNANELADKLEQGHWEGGTREQAATMLRQQKAEYYSLLVNHDKLYAKVVEQQAEIEALKAKTLTDEEITEVFDTTFEVHDYQDSFIKFARAILRKAQEK